MDKTTAEALKLKCPACGAEPNIRCTRIEGTVMPIPHSKRKELVAVSPFSKQDRIFASVPSEKSTLIA